MTHQHAIVSTTQRPDTRIYAQSTKSCSTAYNLIFHLLLISTFHFTWLLLQIGGKNDKYCELLVVCGPVDKGGIRIILLISYLLQCGHSLVCWFPGEAGNGNNIMMIIGLVLSITTNWTGIVNKSSTFVRCDDGMMSQSGLHIMVKHSHCVCAVDC